MATAWRIVCAGLGLTAALTAALNGCGRSPVGADAAQPGAEQAMAPARQQAQTDGPESLNMAQNLDAIAAGNAKPTDLMNAAANTALSKQESDHQSLRFHLVKPFFLARLDSEAEYAGPPRQLRLAKVIKALMDNRCDAADKTLATLASDAHFVSIEPRQNLMIEALVPVRPSPMAAVEFWKVHCTPKAPYKHVTMSALADNYSEPALALFEQMITEPGHDAEDKVAWMRDGILRNRYQPTILAMSERMLTKSLSPALREDLVAALFDYRETWYVSCDPPTPPERALASKEAKVALKRIADYVLASVPLTAQTKAAVEADLRWLSK